jgi:alpha-glucosidase (family GH31 glycosyl hydrolase)
MALMEISFAPNPEIIYEQEESVRILSQKETEEDDESIPSYMVTPNANDYQVINDGVAGDTKYYIVKYFGSDKFYKVEHSPIVRYLNFSYTFFGSNRISVKIKDANHSRWEIPEEYPFPHEKAHSSQYPDDNSCCSVRVTRKPFGFQIMRKETHSIIFDTARSSLMFSDLYIYFSTVLPTPNIYGIGERTFKFKLGPSGTYTVWNMDKPIVIEDGKPGNNVYGHHPVYLQQEEGGEFDIVMLRNSNAMDISIWESKNLSFHVSGGIVDLQFFVGDKSPETAIKSYHEYIGGYTLQPFWTMGFHQSRWGYSSLKHLAGVIQNFRAYDLPLDTVWSDIDYMVKKEDFTIDRVKFPIYSFRDVLRTTNTRWVPIIDAGIKVSGIGYEDGKKEDIFIKNTRGEDLVGSVWPGEVHFPDFFNPRTDDYWCKMLDEVYKMVPYSGIWLDMNEIANFISGEADRFAYGKYDQLPYTPGNRTLRTQTISMDAVHYADLLEYDVHELFGLLQSMSTYRCIKKRSPLVFILSRSTTFGSGQFAAHWTGDNGASWEFLQYSISAMFNFNIYGIPFVGSDICGFMGNTTPRLCARWMQLGALYPFSRNHNLLENIDQEPYAFDEEVLDVSRRALKLRYSLLKWYYSLYVKNRKYGTVIRPLFFEYPDDKYLYRNEANYTENQFLIGSHLMVAPIVNDSEYTLAYFPQDTWYDYYGGKLLQNSSEKHKIRNIFSPFTVDIPLFLRGGIIIHTQNIEHVQTTDDLKDQFTLIIAFKEINATYSKAEGQIMGIKNYSDERVFSKCVKQNCMIKITAEANITNTATKLKIEFNAEDPSEINLEWVGIRSLKLYGLPATSNELFCTYQFTQNVNDAYVGVKHTGIKKLKVLEKHSFELDFEEPLWVGHSSQIIGFTDVN